MSELYLVLRRKIDDVVAWVPLGKELLHSARKGKGLSYEAMGRNLNVAAKTWERWEKAGHVPRHMVGQVADLLDLEITRPDQTRVSLPHDPSGPVTLEVLDRRLEELAELVAEGFELLGANVTRRLPA